MKDFIIDLLFDDGTQKKFDFSVWLKGEVFLPLKKKEYFKKFFLDNNTVAWPNGADIVPETLYEAKSYQKNEDSKSTSSNTSKQRRIA